MNRVLISVIVVVLSFLVTACEPKQTRVTEEVKEGVKLEKVTPPTPAVSRREVLRKQAHAAASAAASSASTAKIIDLRSIATREKNNGQVVRRRVNDFYATNLGLPEVKGGTPIPDYLAVSFDANMVSFWKRKVSREEVSDSTLGKAPEILERYLSSDRGFTTLASFIGHVDAVVVRAKRSLDWDKLCPRYRLDASRCSLLKSVLANLEGRDFIAYGMTELLPGDTDLNVKYLDLVLKNAGASYLMHFPALHDNMLSLGFYQFTSFALRKDDEETEGASIINGFVKEGGMKIPDSVASLRGDDHHVAAVYFAVHNLAKMMKQLDAKGVKTLASKHKNYQDEMVMFIASAHHLPGAAWKGTATWVNAGMRYGMERSYTKAIGLYAIKTHGNLIALYTAYPHPKPKRR